jgi:aminomethyltransferase
MKTGAKKTPLYNEHVKLNAKIVEFAGFLMPLEFEGVISEHITVREKVGIFDVSHMGEIWITGKNATNWLQTMVTNNVAIMQPGQAQYNAMLYQEGTVVDDLLVYKFSETEYMLCVNAANIEKDYQWLLHHQSEDVSLENNSDKIAQIAIQGPMAINTLQEITDLQLNLIKYYRFQKGNILGNEAIISRTGYTGEDGFEIYIKNDYAETIWQKLLEVGKKYDIKPAGLAARDTLRLEAGMLLYGNDMDQCTTALEAGLDWIIKFDKGDFIGKESLLEQKAKGLERKLVGFEMIEPGIARHGYSVVDENMNEIGLVTSGTFSPYLKKSIGMAYLPINLTAVDTEFYINIRDKKRKAKVVALPFYSRKRKTSIN